MSSELARATPSRRAWLLQQTARCGLALGLGTGWELAAASDGQTEGDPLSSMQWPLVRRKFIGDASYRFDARALLKGPPFAEDAMNVPMLLDARPLAQEGIEIERIVIVADRNPVQQVLTFEPRRVLPVLAFRFRLEQGSPVRALIRTRRGDWLVAQTWVSATGGGCTLPGATRADGSWSQTLNQVQTRVFRSILTGAGLRLRLRVMHPMDTGLVAGIPAFHIETLELHDLERQPWFRIELHEPVSENPLFTLDLDPAPSGPMLLLGRDNNGNRIQHALSSWN